MSLANFKKKYFDKAAYFPPIEVELGENVKYLTGKILNAGSGTWRSIDKFVNGQVINQDIINEPGIDIVSPLNKIPVEDEYFDSILCNAVLEHVSNPVEVINELYRVLKKGGYIYLAVPFMQPEHLSPTDYQRYTIDGLKKLAMDAKFSIIQADGKHHNAYQTIAWIVQEWLLSKKTISYLMLRMLLFPIFRYKCRTSKTFVHSIASGYKIIATK
jgi:ubiquinone/menaquinone biosynthesis C-methylase UbiE